MCHISETQRVLQHDQAEHVKYMSDELISFVNALVKPMLKLISSSLIGFGDFWSVRHATSEREEGRGNGAERAGIANKHR